MNHRSLVAFVGLGLVALGQVQLLLDYSKYWSGLALIGAGMLLFFVNALGAQQHPGEPMPHEGDTLSDIRTPLPKSLPRRTAPLLSLSAITALVLGFRTVQDPFVPRYMEYFGLWLAGAAILVLACLLPGELGSRVSAVRRALVDETGHVLAVVGLTALGLVWRTVNLSSIPGEFSADEAAFALQGAHLAEGVAHYNPFAPGWLTHPYLFSFLTIPSIGLMGRTIAAVRFPSALLGALTIPAVYLLVRELYGRRAGLVAAAFVAGFNVHVHFSRLTLNNIADPLFGALALTLGVRALRSGRLADYAMTGLILGASQYFYTGAHLLPLIMGGIVLFAILFRRHVIGTSGREALLRIGVLAMGFVVVTWPYCWHYIVTATPIATRLSHTGLFQTGAFQALAELLGWQEVVVTQVRSAVLGLVLTRDTGMFYGRVAPFMGFGASVPLLVGSAIGLAAGFQRRPTGDGRPPLRYLSWLPHFWIAATMLTAGVLLIGTPSYQRYVELIPAAAALVGIGIVGTVDLLFPSADRAGRRLRATVPILAVAVLIAGELLFYFGTYVDSPYSYARDTGSQRQQQMSTLVEMEHNVNPNIRVVFLTHLIPYSELPLLHFFTPEVDAVDITGPWQELDEQVSLSGETLLIVDPERLAELGLIAQRFPGTEVKRHSSWDNESLFYTYRIRGTSER